ncbi:MAG: hypothetical protein OIN89_03900 [Candidatus Methanoperedens sp.]|nr:hypothetical protein [Candidatus Methanoperedens sp.]
MEDSGFYNMCRACGWFDPACDKCELHGMVKPDDSICHSFILAEE